MPWAVAVPASPSESNALLLLMFTTPPRPSASMSGVGTLVTSSDASESAGTTSSAMERLPTSGLATFAPLSVTEV